MMLDVVLIQRDCFISQLAQRDSENDSQKPKGGAMTTENVPSIDEVTVEELTDFSGGQTAGSIGTLFTVSTPGSLSTAGTIGTPS